MASPVLVLIETGDPDIAAKLTAAGLVPTFAISEDERRDVIAGGGAEFRAVLTHGAAGLRADEIARLPNLGIISALGAGHENVDDEAAHARGIVVTHGPGTNDSTVADHAMALLLAITRNVVDGHARVQAGGWRIKSDVLPIATGKRLGVLGLGMIGQQIARRCVGGFDMTVAYHNRRPVEGSPYRYMPTLIDLAEASDYLVIATPGGAATRGLVDAEVLKALGPHGFLINIARGSVVDTGALVAALHAGGIAGAGLDVVDGEPIVPKDLLAAPRLIITPHTAGRSPESIEAMVGLVIANMTAHFAGKPVLTPIKAS